MILYRTFNVSNDIYRATKDKNDENVPNLEITEVDTKLLS